MSIPLFGDLEPVVRKSAVISPCGTYRYELRRQWGPEPPVGWVMLNPSTADAELDDPTIRRCISFSGAWGAGGIVVVNLYALRATDPGELARHHYPVGPENDRYWRAVADECSSVVCAWGAHPQAVEVARAVMYALRQHREKTWCLGTTKTGAPRHPLYVKSATELVRFGGSR